MIDGVVGRVVEFLPWGRSGVPKHIVVEPEPGGYYWKPGPDWVSLFTWDNVELRVLPDGAIQLSAPTEAGVRLIRLGAAAAELDVFTDGYLIDAVLLQDESAILLEQLNKRLFAVRRVTRDDSTVWTLEYPLSQGGIGDFDSRDSNLLAFANGVVLLVSRTALYRVDDGSGQRMRRWVTPCAVAYPDGRVGYSRPRADRPSEYDYAVVELETGDETVVEVGYELQSLLVRLIGVDGDGNVYGRNLDSMSPAGESWWRLRTGGIVVSADQHVVCQTFGDRHRQSTRIGEADLDSDDRWPGELIGLDADGGYLLRKSATQFQSDTVSVYDSAGRFVRTEPSPDDVALTHFVTQPLTRSSVTRDGEVLVVVKGPNGVYVVGLRPDRAQ